MNPDPMIGDNTETLGGSGMNRSGIRWQMAVLIFMFALGWPMAAVKAQSLNSEEIVRALTPQNQSGPKVRSFMQKPSGNDRGIKITGDLPPDLPLPRINLTVNFEYDSANLTNDGILTLRVLANALIDPRLQAMVFQVAGHTDQRGSFAYNQRLSERRARTVTEHLVAFYGIDPRRLMPVGYGERYPVDPYDRSGAKNRRVEIINVSASF